jgi:hypothetical protein
MKKKSGFPKTASSPSQPLPSKKKKRAVGVKRIKK